MMPLQTFLIENNDQISELLRNIIYTTKVISSLTFALNVLHLSTKNESLETFVQSCSGRILTTEAKMPNLNKYQTYTITRITLKFFFEFCAKPSQT